MKKLFVFGALILLPFFAHAQFGGFSDFATSINESDIDVYLSPESPEPFQSVTVRLDSNTVDLNRYQISWVVGGKQILSGIGERTIKATAGAYGSTTQISATIIIDGASVQKNISLSPQDAVVLWEAIDSYVPPFYRGKKMPAAESLIKISGIQNFRTNNSLLLNDAVYLWDRNGNRILGVGGYAKDAIVIKQNRLRQNEVITATISDTENTTQAKKTVSIPVINPELHWYVRNPFGYRLLRGVDQGLRINNGNVTLVAEPYFFSTQNMGTDLSYAWKMNNELLYLDPDTSDRELLVKNPEQTGQVTFQLTTTHPNTFLQEAARSISLYFQNETN